LLGDPDPIREVGIEPRPGQQGVQRQFVGGPRSFRAAAIKYGDGDASSVGQARFEHDRRRDRGVVNDQEDQVNVTEALVEELRKRSPDPQIGQVPRLEADAHACSLQLWPEVIGAVKYED
jgi:hypothetical protein